MCRVLKLYLAMNHLQWVCLLLKAIVSIQYDVDFDMVSSLIRKGIPSIIITIPSTNYQDGDSKSTEFGFGGHQGDNDDDIATPMASK